MYRANLLVEGDDVIVSGVRAGESESEIVGLTARVYEEADRQLLRQGGGETARAYNDVVVQEAHVGRQQGHLLLAGFHYIWVTVSDCDEEKNIIFNHCINCKNLLARLEKKFYCSHAH